MGESKKKVLFVVPSLHGGGAERVMVTLLKHLDRKKFSLNLALVKKEGTYLKDVPNDVEIYDLKVGRVRKSFLPLLKLIWRIQPDIAFSTLGHLNLALILLKPVFPKKTKLVVREANTVSEIIKTNNLSRMWRWLYRRCYRKADLIICQSKYMQEDLANNFSIPKEKLVQIYNPVDVDDIRKKSMLGENPFAKQEKFINIVTVGRLSYQKGIDRLIQSIPDLLKVKSNAKLWILGEGSLEDELKSLRDQLDLKDTVFFVGFQENPYVWLKHADLFVLPSNYEGLPNVLLEAIACGCSVLTTDHPGGTREIMEITKQKEYIVKDLEWANEWFRPSYNGSIELLRRHFGLDRIINRYSKIFEK